MTGMISTLAKILADGVRMLDDAGLEVRLAACAAACMASTSRWA
jgi:hypothetical protein